MSTFGRQNRTNTGVAPAQIEVFVRGHFADRLSCRRFLGGALSRCAAEREACLSTRTLRVFQCSAALNHMGGRKGSIQEWNMEHLSMRLVKAVAYFLSFCCRHVVAAFQSEL